MNKIKFERKPFRYPIYRADGELYLMRWNIFQCPLFTIKLHKILKDDDACLHDHPWTFISIILKNGYIEHYDEPVKGKPNTFKRVIERIKGGSIIYRPAKHRHRLQMWCGEPAWTLVITFKRVREWGFWTPLGWVEWYKYEQGSNVCE